MSNQAPTQIPLWNLPDPVTSGSGIQSWTDNRGEVWVAKVGVRSGNWYRAREVIKSAVYRSAAFNTSTAGSFFTYGWDVLRNDTYGIQTPNVYTFSAPVSGWYRFSAWFGVAANAANQWIQAETVHSVSGNLSIDTDQVSVVGNMTIRTNLIWYMNASESVIYQYACSTAGLTGLTGVSTGAMWEYAGAGP